MSEQTDALKFIRDAGHGYLHRHVQQRWVWPNIAHGGGLLFTPEGMSRLSNIFGWIDGIWYSNPKSADEISTNLIENLDFLSKFGGLQQVGNNSVPGYVVQLDDDGTQHNFSVCWYRVIREKEISSAEWKKAVHNGLRHPYDHKPYLLPNYANPSGQAVYEFEADGIMMHILNECAVSTWNIVGQR